MEVFSNLVFAWSLQTLLLTLVTLVTLAKRGRRGRQRRRAELMADGLMEPQFSFEYLSVVTPSLPDRATDVSYLPGPEPDWNDEEATRQFNDIVLMRIRLDDGRTGVVDNLDNEDVAGLRTITTVLDQITFDTTEELSYSVWRDCVEDIIQHFGYDNNVVFHWDTESGVHFSFLCGDIPNEMLYYQVLDGYVVMPGFTGPENE
jgi:hypothetical protein